MGCIEVAREITVVPPPRPRRRFRIAVFTLFPSPYQRDLFTAMAKHPGLDVRVYYYAPTYPGSRWAVAPLPGYARRLPGLPLHAITESCWLNLGALGELRRNDFDLVVVGDYFTATAQIVMRDLTRRGIPWMFWGESPGLAPRGWLGSRLRSAAQRAIWRGASAIVGIGAEATGQYLSMAGGCMPVFNIPYHCDMRPYLAIPRTRYPHRSTVRFLFSGQLIRRKGVDVLLSAFGELVDAGRDAHLTLLGDGPGRRRYAASISPTVRRRVHFAGFQQPPALSGHFAEADVFVLPSRYDGWGVVVNEAIAAGLPVITTSAVGAARDLVQEGCNGHIVPPGDVPALARAMRDLADRPERRRTFGRRSRAMAHAYTTAAGAQRWYDVCRAVLNGIGWTVPHPKSITHADIDPKSSLRPSATSGSRLRHSPEGLAEQGRLPPCAAFM